MEKYSRSFDQVASIVTKACNKTIDAYKQHDLPEEDHITVSLVTRISDGIDSHFMNGIHWRAKVFTSHGIGAEEKSTGADFVGVLKLNLIDYQVEKGFLVQAKRQEPGERFDSGEWNRLVEQCQKMLVITPHSYIYVYCHNGIFTIPAIKVVSCTHAEDLHTLNPTKLGQFYKEHLICKVGDRRINSKLLDEIYEMRTSKTGLLLLGQNG